MPASNCSSRFIFPPKLTMLLFRKISSRAFDRTAEESSLLHTRAIIWLICPEQPLTRHYSGQFLPTTLRRDLQAITPCQKVTQTLRCCMSWHGNDIMPDTARAWHCWTDQGLTRRIVAGKTQSEIIHSCMTGTVLGHFLAASSMPFLIHASFIFKKAVISSFDIVLKSTGLGTWNPF